MVAILLFASMLLLATAFAQQQTGTGENNDRRLRCPKTLSEARIAKLEGDCSYLATLCTIARSGRECGRASAVCRCAMRMKRKWRKLREGEWHYNDGWDNNIGLL